MQSPELLGRQSTRGDGARRCFEEPRVSALVGAFGAVSASGAAVPGSPAGDCGSTNRRGTCRRRGGARRSRSSKSEPTGCTRDAAPIAEASSAGECDPLACLLRRGE
eukprot:117040-Prorocentrum_minimum.AAC.1